MDFKEVDRVINSHGFASEPAFKDVYISVHPIPQYDPKTCVLGLYYPDEEVIVIPPDGLESTLLHELGHRYSDYYYGDISEPAAENFRKHYQGAAALMYQGRDFARFPHMGMLFTEGEPGAIEMDSTRVSNEALECLYYDLYSSARGEAMPRIYNGGSAVRLEFVKSLDWFPMIARSRSFANLNPLTYSILKIGGR